MSEAIETQGTFFELGDGAITEVFTTIGEVVDFNGPGGSAAVIRTTHLASTGHEKRMGLPDEGQFSFSLNMVPGDLGQVALRAARAARTERGMKLHLTDAGTTVLTFRGFVLEYSISGGVDDIVKAQCTIEITGLVVYA